jgi:hypothetical protein
MGMERLYAYVGERRRDCDFNQREAARANRVPRHFLLDATVDLVKDVHLNHYVERVVRTAPESASTSITGSLFG